MTTYEAITSLLGEPEKDSPAMRSAGYDRMGVDWEPIDALRGGTPAMRNPRWLPAMPKEHDQAHAERIDLSVLYPGFVSAVHDAADPPFSKEIEIETGTEGGKLPMPLDELHEDADGEGQSLTELGYCHYEDGASYGLSHILVDMPPNPGGVEQPDGTVRDLNLADERRLGLRPRFLQVDARTVFYWRRDADHVDAELREFRRVTSRTSRTGDFGEKEEQVIERWLAPGEAGELGQVEVYYHDQKSQKWREDVTARRTYTFPRIPLVTTYFKKVGFMEAKPPFADLAWTNVRHFQLTARMASLLDFILIPILWIMGANPDLMRIIVRAGYANGTEDGRGDAKFVEHSGKSVEAGEREELRLRRLMKNQSLEPHTRVVAAGPETATKTKSDDQKSLTMVEKYVRAVEATLKEAYEIAAEWRRIGGDKAAKLPPQFEVNIYSDFGVVERAALDLAELRALVEIDLLPLETYFKEAKRRRLFPDTFKPEEEARKAGTAS